MDDRRDTNTETHPHGDLTFVEPDDVVVGRAATRGTTIVATERRMAVMIGERLALDLPYEGLRRIQFDIERQRPATLVIVPELPHDEPQVISVHPDEYPEVAEVLVAVGRFLAATN